MQCCPCCHSKKLNRWSLHVGFNNFFYSNLISTSLPSQGSAAGEMELSEPEVVCTSPLRSGIEVSSAFCDTVENWAKYASVASLSVDRYALSLYVCGNASQHHAC